VKVVDLMKRLCDDCGKCVDEFKEEGYFQVICIVKEQGKRYYARDICPNCYNEIFKGREMVNFIEIPKISSYKKR
jgi:protein associated with RNAse G/E